MHLRIECCNRLWVWLAALSLPMASLANGPAGIYWVADSEAIHLTDRPLGDVARLLIPTPSAADPMSDVTAMPHAAAGVAEIVRQAAQANALDQRLLHAVIATESGYGVRAVSPRGAQGLMQLMPATAREYGVTDPFDPRQNVGAGALHLRKLLDQFGQNTALALAAYNAGAAAVTRYGHKVPPFAETTTYVHRVLRRFDALRGQSPNPSLAHAS